MPVCRECHNGDVAAQIRDWIAVRAAKDAKALFGNAPKACAYDRADWSA